MSARHQVPSPATGARLAELLMSAAAELTDVPRSGLAPMGIRVRDGRLSLGRLREVVPSREALDVVAGFSTACWIGPAEIRVPDLGRLTYRSRAGEDCSLASQRLSLSTV